MFDLIIKNGFVADGSGEKGYYADVAVKDGKIAKIEKDIQGEAKETIDAKGRVVTPGFVDNHSHTDGSFLFDTDGYNILEQGITTEIAGMCGSFPTPAHSGTFIRQKGISSDEKIQEVAKICDNFNSFSAHVEKMELPANIAFYIGHGAVRGRVMGYSPDAPNEKQLEEMKNWCRQAMEQGFIGMTTGLIYPPSIYGEEPELTELMKVVSEYGGIYCSHIRGESDTLIEAIEECIRIGENSGANVVVSHHKVGGKHNKGKSAESLKRIEEANARGKIKVLADQYPYIAGATALVSALPPAYAVDGIDKLVENLKSPAFRKEVTKVLEEHAFGESLIYCSGFEGCLVIGAPFTPELVGKNIAEIAQERGADPYETVYDVIVENNGNVNMAYFMQNEDDMMNILKHPTTMPGTDAGHLQKHGDPEQVGGAHPRYISTLPKHMRLVRENNLMSMEKAIMRATSMPAQFANLKGVGLLKEGYNADILVLDWENLGETNDFIHPFRPNKGIDYAIVNGQVAVKAGKATGVKAGKFLRRQK